MNERGTVLEWCWRHKPVILEEKPVTHLMSKWCIYVLQFLSHKIPFCLTPTQTQGCFFCKYVSFKRCFSPVSTPVSQCLPVITLIIMLPYLLFKIPVWLVLQAGPIEHSPCRLTSRLVHVICINWNVKASVMLTYSISHRHELFAHSALYSDY